MTASCSQNCLKASVPADPATAFNVVASGLLVVLVASATGQLLKRLYLLFADHLRAPQVGCAAAKLHVLHLPESPPDRTPELHIKIGLGMQGIGSSNLLQGQAVGRANL